jgi:hypothetical protein
MRRTELVPVPCNYNGDKLPHWDLQPLRIFCISRLMRLGLWVAEGWGHHNPGMICFRHKSNPHKFCIWVEQDHCNRNADKF